MNILVIEDEKKLVDILKKALKSQYYTVDTAYDGEEGLKKSLKNTYDLIVLDIMLPKKDGMEICREIRKNNIHTPVIMLTARGVLEDRITGLDAGADDYLQKPFEMTELYARVRALLRRPRNTDSLIFKVKDLTMDTKAHEVTRGNKNIKLTPKEYKILYTLMSRSGEALTRDELINSAWGPNFKEDNHELNVHIRYLRAKVDNGSSKPLIHTVRGVGYTLK